MTKTKTHIATVANSTYRPAKVLAVLSLITASYFSSSSDAFACWCIKMEGGLGNPTWKCTEIGNNPDSTEPCDLVCGVHGFFVGGTAKGYSTKEGCVDECKTKIGNTNDCGA